jgi:hypothetical protein
MLKKKHQIILTFLFLLTPSFSYAVNLTSLQSNYTTTSDITIDDNGINSSFSGNSSTYRTITNLHIITTGPSTSGYAIRASGDYNIITNSENAEIITTGSSGRGISISDFSEVYNLGSITTSGSNSPGIYAGGESNNINNSGSITTTNSDSYGISLNNNSNIVINSGTINTKVYGINVVGNNNQITNSGNITTSVSSSAHGIFLSSSGGSSSNIVINSGTINSSGNGIYAKDLSSNITNSGTITTASSSSIYGIRTEGNNAIINNSGTINSTNYAIHNSGSNAVINNSGTLNGGVYIGSGTLNILNGTINGVVNGVSKAGSVNIGSNSITTNFTQSFDFTDLNSLTIKEGSNLNAHKNITADNINLDNNSSLTIYNGSFINSAITAVSSSSGNLNIIGTSFSLSKSIGTSNNKIANLNIDENGSFTATNNIYVSNINIHNGNLNLNQNDNLTIFGNITGNGSSKINIGSNNQIIDGNFNLTSGDILAVTIGNSENGTLTVNGIANIDNNTKLEITNLGSGYIINGTKFTILNSNSGSSISNISNITINGQNSENSILKFSSNASSDSLDITIARLDANQVTNNENSQNIYQVINNIGSDATAELSSFQSYLDNLNLGKSNITETINQIAPNSSKAMLINNLNIVSNAIKPIESRLYKVNLDNQNNFKKGLWLESFGNKATQKEVKNDEGFNINAIGLIMGFDSRVNDSNLIGVGFGYIQSNIKSDNNLKTNSVNSYQANIYNSLNFDNYFIDSIASFTFHQYNATKSITAINESSTANFDGQSYDVKIAARYLHNFNKELNLSPIISFKYSGNQISAYEEKGSGSLNLKVQSLKANFFEGRVGINFGYVDKFFFFPEFKKIATNFKISYGKNFINDTPTTIANFVGQNKNFSTQILQIDRTSLNFETEIIGYHIDDLTFSANYNFEHRNSYQSHFLSLKMRQEF